MESLEAGSFTGRRSRNTASTSSSRSIRLQGDPLDQSGRRAAPQGQVIGLSWLTFIPPEAGVAAAGAGAGAGNRRAIQLRAHDRGDPDDTNAWYACRLAPIRDGEAITGALIITRDITDKKEREAQLIASDRMASVGTLAAGVAHEINNPLAVVISNLELAIAGTEDFGTTVDTSALIEDLRRCAGSSGTRAADRSGSEAVLAQHRAEPGLAVDLHATLETTLRIAGNEIRHRARLMKDLGTISLVTANEARLGQVLLNLIINAAQALPEGQGRAERDPDHHQDGRRRHGRHRRERHGRRDVGSGPEAALHAVLHDQAGRLGHRAWPVDLAGDHPLVQRGDPCA